MRKIIFTVFALLIISGCNKDPLLPIDENKANHITAKYSMPSVNRFIKNYDIEKYYLTYIRSKNVDFKGYSNSWKYEYLKGAEGNLFTWNLYLSSYYSYVKLDSALTKKILFGGSIITQEWVDSDKALEVAEQNGGSKFRSDYPDYTISAELHETLIIHNYTTWIITYSSKKLPLVTKYFAIDAVSGMLKQ